jgi:hypothetical protein
MRKEDVAETDVELMPKRGTALLVIALIVIAASTVIVFFPRDTSPFLEVRVAIIDSGINHEESLLFRIVAEKSFITLENNYNYTDNSTEDSYPNGNLHGTYIARIISENTVNSALVNAKVVTSGNEATEYGIINAIYWAVLEENCTVINISLGKTPTRNDPLKRVIEWAAKRGVSIIAAVGNRAQNDMAGTSIDTPAIYREVIAVAGVDESGTPYAFSGRGPLRYRTIKPDISALGMYSDSTSIVFGTSFAAPRVTSAVLKIIKYCEDNELQWTPGMIKATLLASASSLPYDYWEVGTGLLDINAAISLLEDAPVLDNLPLVSWATPNLSLFEFERWFVNSSYSIEFSLFTSNEAAFSISYSGSASMWVRGPHLIYVNQTGAFTIWVNVISNQAHENLISLLTLSELNYGELTMEITFDVAIPNAKIAFELSHTPWWMDSLYGQYRGLYETITGLGISVEEIHDRSELIFHNLLFYDAVIVLDPCAWETRLEDGVTTKYSTRYSPSELFALNEYLISGGNLFIIGLDNSSSNRPGGIDVEGANMLLSFFNMSYNYDHTPLVTITVNGIPSTTLVEYIADHPITEGVDEFDYNGCSLNYTCNATALAWTEFRWIDSGDNVMTENRTLIAVLDGVYNGRLVVSGSNFPFDNLGIYGAYKSDQNVNLARHIILWLVGLLEL